MTELSPAAQAVLKAACIHHGLFNEEIIQRRRMLAAALRAVTKELKYFGITEKNILAIAAELEGAQ
jgi:hypothetical protein